MKVQRKVSATTILEADGATVAEVFETLARLESVFHGYETCGLCGGRETTYVVQQDREGNHYYKSVCLSCGGEFRFGVRKAPPGVLFPQLKDADGRVKANGGWSKYEGGKGG